MTEAEKLYHLFRTPTWVLPPRIMAWKMMGQNKELLEILGEIGIDAQENFSQETIERFKSDPEFYGRFVKAVEKEVNNGFPMVNFFFLLSLSFKFRIVANIIVEIGSGRKPTTNFCSTKGGAIHEVDA